MAAFFKSDQNTGRPILPWISSQPPMASHAMSGYVLLMNYPGRQVGFHERQITMFGNMNSLNHKKREPNGSLFIETDGLNSLEFDS